MVNFIKQHWIDIACIAIAIILTVILGSIDTELVKAYGKGMTYSFYAVFSANVMLIPCLTYHHYND